MPKRLTPEEKAIHEHLIKLNKAVKLQKSILNKLRHANNNIDYWESKITETRGIRIDLSNKLDEVSKQLALLNNPEKVADCPTL